MPDVKLFKSVNSDEAHFEKSNDNVAHVKVSRLVGGALSRGGLGAGFALFDNEGYDWTFAYDEVLYILEGHYRVKQGTEVYDCFAGDVVWFPEGSTVRLDAIGRMKCFYTVYPEKNVPWTLGGIPAAPSQP
jgi:ethanolamine utilization protein EutQ